MFPLSDENERGHGPAFVTLAIIALNVLVFLFLQGAVGSQEGADFTYGYAHEEFLLPAEVPVDGTGREVHLLEHVLHRGGVEAVAGEAGSGAVEDLPAAGVEVFLGYAGHGRNLKRTFLLDKERGRRDGGGEPKTNDPSF